MRIRFTIFLTLTLIVALVSSTVFQNRANATVEAKPNQVKPPDKAKTNTTRFTRNGERRF